MCSPHAPYPFILLSLFHSTHRSLCKWFQEYSIRHRVTQTFTDGTPYLDLPPKEELTVEVVFSARERAIYDHAKKELGEEMRAIGNMTSWWPTWNTGATKMRRLASHFMNETNPFVTGIARFMGNANMPASNVAAGVAGGTWENREVTNGHEGMKHATIANIDLTRYPQGLRASILETLQKPPAEFECPICYEQADDSYALTGCGHVFCPGCIIPIACAKDICPMCRTQMHSAFVSVVKAEVAAAPQPEVPLQLSQDKQGNEVVPAGGEPAADAPMTEQFVYERTQMSSKIRAMLAQIRSVRAEDPTAKFIVFTQFESTIRAIEAGLTSDGHHHQKIAGAMTQNQRSRTLAEFNENENCTVFILTVRSGACGLNLTAANHVFLMEPCLNPAQELQAVGRCHRITQTKTVYAHRFVVKDTIEEVCTMPTDIILRPFLKRKKSPTTGTARGKGWRRWRQNKYHDIWACGKVLRTPCTVDNIFVLYSCLHLIV